MIIVYLRHVRKAKYCLSGTRKFFSENGLDYQDFIVNGIPAEKLLSLNNEMSNMVVRVAQDEIDSELKKQTL